MIRMMCMIMIRVELSMIIVAVNIVIASVAALS